ncbi:TetR/AcrR family transcriptional regulator [Agrococcus sp. SGAir0287]|uniref:TetR/AcrR family transcriptional regulator n=1 Tax=Agrococcus sp. SGAir0287 TaxID=2070347 RepID=UPI00158696AA|nr:TetR/AcrR family transcriptional regulator [Agrococcus sp. SGAir0287]
MTESTAIAGAAPEALPDGIGVRIETPSPRAGRRIDALLDAAAHEVAARGRESLTTGDVAARAEVSIGTVYRYFPDRTALLEALGTRARLRLHRHLDEILAIAAADDASVARAIVAAIRATRDAEPSYLALGIGDRVDPVDAFDAEAAWIEATGPAVAALVALGADAWRARTATLRAAMLVDAMVRAGGADDARVLDVVAIEAVRRSLDPEAFAEAA